jgi:hypothetical protein
MATELPAWVKRRAAEMTRNGIRRIDAMTILALRVAAAADLHAEPADVTVDEAARALAVCAVCPVRALLKTMNYTV